MNKKKNHIIIPPSIHNQINEIAFDSIHGATFLTEKAINIIESYLIQSKLSQSFSMEILEKILYLIIKAQPTMASLVTFTNELLIHLSKSIQKNDMSTVFEKEIKKFLKDYSHKFKQANQRIALHTIKHLPKSFPIATYSASSSVQKSIELLAKQYKDMHVYCAESRPKNEGVKLAKSLAEKNISTSLMTDASLFSSIMNVKILLIGADAITYNGIIHKIGSNPLVNQAKNHNVKVYCLSNSKKILPSSYKIPKEVAKPKTDLINKNQKNLKVINYYFDNTPLNLFDGIITELGMYNATEIKKSSKQKKLHLLVQQLNNKTSETKK